MSFEQHQSGILVPANFAAPGSRTAPKMGEVATTRDGRDITRGYVDPIRIQPSTDSVLQIRGNGDYKIYKELLRDDQVMACFSQRRLSVVGKETVVEPGGNSKADKMAADHLREQLETFGWDRVTDKMLFGVYYGYAVAEIMWARDGNHIAIENIKVRDRSRFGFDGNGDLRLITHSDPDGEKLPDRKFWTFSNGADHDDEPYGLGLAHWLYWPVFFKRAGLRYWMTFLERFGQPTTVGKYAPGATHDQQRTLLDALEAISTDTGIIVPQGMEIGLLEAARSGAGDYSKLYEVMDNATAKITLGQTASTQGTAGKLGNDELQGEVRTDLIKADADLVCESFNRSVARWLCEYNHPTAKTPRVIRKVEPEEDQVQATARDKAIFDMGFKPSLQHIKDNYGGDWVEKTSDDNSDTVKNRTANFAEALPTPPEQMLDRARTEGEVATNTWIEQIRKLVNDADSVEQFRDGLIELYPNIKLDEYVVAMTQANVAARLAGRNEVLEDKR